MFRWAGRARIALILLVLMLAIYVPVVTSGYMDISRGQDALRHADDVARTMQQISADDFASAAQSYKSASWKLPWRSDLLEQAAMAMSHLDTEKAISLFEQARERGALSASGWGLYGFQYWATSRDQQAVQIWKAGLKQYPTYYQFYSLMHLAYRQLKDFPGERMALETWLNSADGSAMDHYELGELLMASNPDQARAELMRAAAMGADFSEAVQTLDATLALASLESNLTRRLVIIGRGLGLVNDWPLAQYDFQQAVNADLLNAEAWAWLGEAQQQNKQDGKAALDRALLLDPNSSLVHGLRGLYWKRQGKPKDALEEYQAAAKLEPKNAEWQVALGDAYASTGDLVQALAAYVTATTLAPDNATYWRLLTLFCADNGVQVQDVGLPAAKKAAEIAPNDPQVLDALGWAYSQAGLLHTAEQTLNKAIKLEPANTTVQASLHLHLAETYLREGNVSLAQTELGHAVTLDPNGPYGTFAAQLLKQYFP